MGSMLAFALLMGHSSAVDAEDFIPTSKLSHYTNQVKMRSEGNEEDNVKGKEAASENKKK